ncbi:hypothetical protein PsYK624_079150 [Phanerochaete sordida]|uniref:Uncharacterized protein n=1 Tax=Phanerochaete sordida TaxID=48140 RepID=A0A9P3LEM5_9APHY|nr:hypothetical protein PsYK624_079150 [Phanerochaete sordida]
MPAVEAHTPLAASSLTSVLTDPRRAIAFIARFAERVPSELVLIPGTDQGNNDRAAPSPPRSEDETRRACRTTRRSLELEPSKRQPLYKLYEWGMLRG